jgi:hypothetical protein
VTSGRRKPGPKPGTKPKSGPQSVRMRTPSGEVATVELPWTVLEAPTVSRCHVRSGSSARAGARPVGMKYFTPDDGVTYKLMSPEAAPPGWTQGAPRKKKAAAA